jgi:hypothetical protein
MLFNGCKGPACKCVGGVICAACLLAGHNEHCSETKRPAFCNVAVPELIHGPENHHRPVWLTSPQQVTTTSSIATTVGSSIQWFIKQG